MMLNGSGSQTRTRRPFGQPDMADASTSSFDYREPQRSSGNKQKSLNQDLQDYLEVPSTQPPDYLTAIAPIREFSFKGLNSQVASKRKDLKRRTFLKQKRESFSLGTERSERHDKFEKIDKNDRGTDKPERFDRIEMQNELKVL